MKRRNRPYRERPLFVFAAAFLLVPGWCRVNVATPKVTRRTTAYLYSGYRFRNIVRWRNMTGRSLQDFARMKVR